MADAADLYPRRDPTSRQDGSLLTPGAYVVIAGAYAGVDGGTPTTTRRDIAACMDCGDNSQSSLGLYQAIQGHNLRIFLAVLYGRGLVR